MNKPVLSQKFATEHPDQYILALARKFECFKSSLEDWKRFDSKKFWKIHLDRTTAIHECAMFVLNVWDPAGAKSQGWHFNLFDFIRLADANNQSVVYEWLNAPAWP